MNVLKWPMPSFKDLCKISNFVPCYCGLSMIFQHMANLDTKFRHCNALKKKVYDTQHRLRLSKRHMYHLMTMELNGRIEDHSPPF